jgi:hypothetical protein
MKKEILLPLCVVFGFLLIACAKTEVTTNSSAPAASSPAASTAASPAATTKTTAGTTGEKIGVPECDEFIAKYDACVSSKVPESARAQYKSSIEQWRSSWRTLAANPLTKATLATVCKQSEEQAKAAMKSYGCTF